MAEKPTQVLLIEDNPADARLIRELLRESAGPAMAVHPVDSLAAGLAHLSANPVDIVLLDLTLPDSAGIETFRRARSAAPHMPFILLTHLDDEAMAINMVKEGAQDYLVKGQADGHLLSRAIQYGVERKRNELALKNYQDRLEDLVAERTDALRAVNVQLRREIEERKQTEEKLRKAIEQLEAHDRAKSQFVFNTSHELKTPLASMGYAVDNLLKGVVGPVPDRIRSYLLMIEEDCRRLRNTVSDILDLSRIEAKSLTLNKATLPVARIVRRTVATMTRAAAEKGIQFQTSVPDDSGFVDCDTQKLERAILNVLDNAVKFTPPKGTVLVTAAPAPNHPLNLTISVTDAGVGISPQNLGRVTERYFREGEHVTGTGLGLSICKEIVELHGGRISIASPPAGRERGTQVDLLLPRAEAPRLVAVDDDEGALKLLRAQLGGYGYRVTACRGGEQALDALGTEEPQILIVDLLMPVLDGIQLINRIKAEARWRHIPILAITGGELDRARSEALAGYDIPALTKPWQREDLLTRIENLVVGNRYADG